MDKTCEGGCGSTQLVIAQYRISLHAFGLDSRFCPDCLPGELKRLKLRSEDPHAPEDGDEQSHPIVRGSPT